MIKGNKEKSRAFNFCKVSPPRDFYDIIFFMGKIEFKSRLKLNVIDSNSINTPQDSTDVKTNKMPVNRSSNLDAGVSVHFFISNICLPITDTAITIRQFFVNKDILVNHKT